MLHFIRHRKLAFLAILFALLAFQTLGWFLAWDMARLEVRQHARREMKRLPSGLLQLTLSARQLAQCRVDAHEIRFAGRLYDIQSTVLRGDSLQLQLWHDTREEALYSALGELLAPAFKQGETPEQAPVCLALFKWMQSDFLLPDDTALPVSGAVEPRLSFTCQIPGQQIALSRTGPPPKG